MIILDTNVLSALMRADPDVAVVDWLDQQPAESVWTTSISLFGVRTGLELLGSSRRRQRLEAAFQSALSVGERRGCALTGNRDSGNQGVISWRSSASGKMPTTSSGVRR